MLMGFIWTLMTAAAIVYSCAVGSVSEVSNAVTEGAYAAVRLCIETGGIICLWCAVMELMRECGIAEGLSRLLRPVLGKLFPESAGHEEIMEPLSANVSANILGLGNAATPMGIRAAQGMAALGRHGEASDDLCRLVVLNTASVQLVPTTIAAIRAAEGASAPFDILPAVWISSALSLAAGLGAAYLLARLSA